MKNRIIVIVTFIIMVVVNALANILPINGIGTGEVSDYYANLFAPAGLTFSIWGLIYLLLAAFVVYQTIALSKNEEKNTKMLLKIGAVFSVSSLINSAWIFAWHYKIITLTVFLMLGILICLIIIVNTIRKQDLSGEERFFVKLPFSVYFGWITVATIANITAFLVSIGFDGFLFSEPVCAAVIIGVGAVIGIATIINNKDYAYGLVIVWAYIGILIKHISSNGFNGGYPQIITTVAVCLVLLGVVNIYYMVKNPSLK